MEERVVPPRTAEERPSGLTTLLRRVAADSAGRALELLRAGGVPLGLDPGTAHHCVYALVDMTGDDPDEPLAAAMVIGPDAGGRAELRALAVAAAYRESGLGGRILAAVVDLLRTTGARHVLASAGGHAYAEGLYRQAGFRPVVRGAGREDGTPPHALDSAYELEL
jgi:GNAT superfamily N-acetyltransferase